MNDQVDISLQPEQFRELERTLVEWDEFRVSTFRYSTGVAGLRVTNAVGEIEFLPFQGQQIWRAEFLGRPLTMRSMFDEPNPTTEYLATYGGFFIHCGASAMGSPSAADGHALHGELPNAAYQHAGLHLGTDGNGSYLAITGTLEHAIAFTHRYVARPTIRLRPTSTRMTMQLDIENRGARPMELMYLAHINFAPIDGATILDTVPPGPAYTRVIHSDQTLAETSVAYRDMLTHHADHPDSHRTLTAGQTFEPEIVFAVDCSADVTGWATTMQLHPDGTSDFVRHRPDQLDHGIRWISRGADQEALGMLLPATAEPGGHLAELAKGNMRQLAASEVAHYTIEFGALDGAATAEMVAEVAAVRAGWR
ncbi:DUF4432 family protein [Gemmatimonas sp.]|uniref:DUF4432 family protein n=1 Tax=Gemmatimonas sp. TaxID=1962908 RepID=UPI003563E979